MRREKNQLPPRKDAASVKYFADFMIDNEIDKSAYSVISDVEDWKEDVKIFGEEMQCTRYEVKTCNAKFSSSGLLADNATYLHYEDTPLIPRNTKELSKELNEIYKHWNAKNFKPNNAKNIIPKHVRGKNIYITLTASNIKGEVLAKDTKVRKMLEGNWGLAIIYTNGIKVYNPQEFKDAILSFAWIHSNSNRLGAQRQWNKKDWKLNLVIDQNKGRFFNLEVPKDIFW